jgi:hypothetical protein
VLGVWLFFCEFFNGNFIIINKLDKIYSRW